MTVFGWIVVGANVVFGIVTGSFVELRRRRLRSRHPLPHHRALKDET